MSTDSKPKPNRVPAELLLGLVVGAAAFILATVFDAVERLSEWSQRHEPWQVDEVLLAATAGLAFSLALFCIRRWRELTSEVGERGRAEEALRESERKYRDLVENLSEVVYALDDRGVITYASKAATTLGGYPASEIVGRSFTEFVHPDDLPALLESYSRTIAGSREPSEYRVLTKWGDARWVRTFSSPILDGERIVGLQAVLMDISDRKWAEEALRASEERLRVLVANVPVVLFAVDSQGVFTLSEGKGLELLGLRPGEAVGRSVFEMYEDVPEITGNIRRALAGEAFAATVEVAGLAFETHYMPLRDGEGRVSGVIGVAADVSERRQADQALRYRAEFETLITTISTSFIDLAPEGSDAGVIDALRKIGEFAGVDRSYVFLFRDDGVTIDNSHEWCAEGIEPQIEDLKGIPVDEELPWFAERIRRLETFHVPRVADLPPEAGAERQHFEAQDIQSLVVVPLVYRGTLVGFLGFDSVRSEQAWPEDSIAMLRIVGEILVNALERKRVEEALRESEANYRDIFNNVQDIFYRTSLTGQILEISPSVGRYGYTREGIIGTSVLDVYADPEERAAFVQALIEKGEVVDYELRLKAADGRVVHASASAQLRRGPDGAPQRIEGALRDITERKRAEQALRESEQRYRDLFENANDIIYTHDLTGRFTSINKAAERATGYTQEEALQENIARVVAPEHLERAREMIVRKVRGDPVTTYELEIIAKDGRRVPIEVSTRLIYQGGKPVGVQGVARDIAERKRLEGQLMRMANHDPLTDLFNRHRFQEEVQHQLAVARRYETPGALLFLDLDQFKDVNDSLGHLVGDELLRSVARLLRERVRETDILARLGGDEFAVLLPKTDAAQARAVAGHLVEALRRETFVLDGQPISLTASIGVALLPEHGATVGDLLSRADLAMYQAKEMGRNRFCVYATDGDWQAQIESRLGWQNRLRKALDEDLFLLHAQPILDLRTNEVAGYELLIRMADDDGGIVLPAAFLDTAERFGLIQALDRWVVRRAIHLIAEGQRAGRDLRLEVNLSGKAFADSELLPLIRRELAAAAIDPARLILEVTETAAIANIHEAQAFLKTLRGLGCRFALDDFGAGFSSFYHLKHLPVDYLKIDGSFIRDLPRSPVDQHLVKAIVEVAHGLGKATIAEFVGSDETIELLRQYGVDYAQGYHVGRPRDVLEILSELGVPRERAA